MAGIDILAALHDSNPERGPRRCKLQQILDGIDDSTPGKADLLNALADAKGYPALRLTLTFSAIGTPVDRGLINDHRARRCRCYR